MHYPRLDPEPSSATEQEALRQALDRDEKTACPWCGETSAVRSWGDGRAQLKLPPREPDANPFVPSSEISRRNVPDPEQVWRIELYCENPACHVREFEIRALRI